MLLTDFLLDIRDEKAPEAFERIAAFRTAEVREYAELLRILGRLEPESGHRPSVFDTVSAPRKLITVPPAGEGAGKNPAVSQVKAFEYGVPPGLCFVFRHITIAAANLTASESGSVEFKGCMAGELDIFCEPSEPEQRPGLLMSIQNRVMLPNTGFELFVRNHDEFSPALFAVSAEVWATR